MEGIVNRSAYPPWNSSEAANIIGDLQKTTSADPPSFAKGSSKASKETPKTSVAKPLEDTLKESKKRGRDFLKMKTSATKTQEQA